MSEANKPQLPPGTQEAATEMYRHHLTQEFMLMVTTLDPTASRENQEKLKAYFLAGALSGIAFVNQGMTQVMNDTAAFAAKTVAEARIRARKATQPERN